MRQLLLCLLAAALAAGEAAVPESTRKLVDESAATAGKARAAYDAAVAKEQEKLAAALQKELEKETRKGNLEGALAIRQLAAAVDGGLLQQRLDGSAPAEGATAPAVAAQPSRTQPALNAPPATVFTDCPLPTEHTIPEGQPEPLEAFIARAITLRLPSGEPRKYQFTINTPGLVVIVVSALPRFAEMRADLERSGFQRLDSISVVNAWYVLNGRLGERFAVGGPGEHGPPTHVLAAGIRQSSR